MNWKPLWLWMWLSTKRHLILGQNDKLQSYLCVKNHCLFIYLNGANPVSKTQQQPVKYMLPAQLFCNMNIVEGYLAISATKQNKKNNRHWKYNCACPGLCFIFISSWKKEKRQKERTLAALNQSCFQSEWNKLQKLDYCNMNHSVRAFILFSSLSPCFWVKLTLACVWDRLEWVLTLRAAWVLARVLPCKIRRTVSDRSCRTESQLSVDLLCHKKARIYTFFVLFSVYKAVRFKVCSNV